jgi:hypothetical protein
MHSRRPFSVLLFARIVLCGTLGLSGCALERSSVSMDSNSRFPFFGFQLAPKKKEEPAYQRSISQHRSRPSDVPKIQPAVREPERESAWPQWLSLPTARPVLPLPRTDRVVEEPRAEQTASSATSVPLEF